VILGVRYMKFAACDPLHMLCRCRRGIESAISSGWPRFNLWTAPPHHAEESPCVQLLLRRVRQ
jgi:hypothetical protein